MVNLAGLAGIAAGGAFKDHFGVQCSTAWQLWRHAKLVRDKNVLNIFQQVVHNIKDIPNMVRSDVCKQFKKQ